jgi:hypothetical protein
MPIEGNDLLIIQPPQFAFAGDKIGLQIEAIVGVRSMIDTVMTAISGVNPKIWASLSDWLVSASCRS